MQVISVLLKMSQVRAQEQSGQHSQQFQNIRTWMAGKRLASLCQE